MLNNNFLRMLFDYRLAMTRRQYWASLIFLLILLALQYGLSKWDIIGYKLTEIGYNEGIDFVIKNYLSSVSHALFNIFYLYTAIVSIAVFTVTIKRCKTLGYSGIISWLFGGITYLMFFSIYGLTNAEFYHKMYGLTSFAYRDETPDYTILTLVAIGLGVLILLGIVVVVILSRQTEVDDEEIIDYDSYDSISCIFGYAKFVLSFYIIFFILQWLLPYITSYEYRFVGRFGSLSVIISYISIYLRIFYKRSLDAGVYPAYIFIGFFTCLIVIGSYIGLSLTSYARNHYYILYFLNLLSFIILNIYTAYTIILIALPGKKREYLE